jgi:hypothetical protein
MFEVNNFISPSSFVLSGVASAFPDERKFACRRNIAEPLPLSSVDTPHKVNAFKKSEELRSEIIAVKSLGRPNNLTMPRRPLSAYNIFFQLERRRMIEEGEEREFTMEDAEELLEQQRIIRKLPKPKRLHRKTHGKVSFKEMARSIADKWKVLNPSSLQMFEQCAESEKKIYLQEKNEVKARQQAANKLAAEAEKTRPKIVEDTSKVCMERSDLQEDKYNFSRHEVSCVPGMRTISDNDDSESSMYRKRHEIWSRMMMFRLRQAQLMKMKQIAMQKHMLRRNKNKYQKKKKLEKYVNSFHDDSQYPNSLPIYPLHTPSPSLQRTSCNYPSNVIDQYDLEDDCKMDFDDQYDEYDDDDNEEHDYDEDDCEDTYTNNVYNFQDIRDDESHMASRGGSNTARPTTRNNTEPLPNQNHEGISQSSQEEQQLDHQQQMLRKQIIRRQQMQLLCKQQYEQKMQRFRRMQMISLMRSTDKTRQYENISQAFVNRKDSNTEYAAKLSSDASFCDMSENGDHDYSARLVDDPIPIEIGNGGV